jgi:hypothetical protein
VGKWLLLIYKVPRDPSAGRVYVWRKVKQLGAILLQDAVWVLPATSRTQEQFQWLAAEVMELGGEATLWASDLLYETQTESLVAQFTAQADAEYAEILQELKRKGADLAALSVRYQQAQSRDFFQSSAGQQVREKLLAARGERNK